MAQRADGMSARRGRIHREIRGRIDRLHVALEAQAPSDNMADSEHFEEEMKGIRELLVRLEEMTAEVQNVDERAYDAAQEEHAQ